MSRFIIAQTYTYSHISNNVDTLREGRRGKKLIGLVKKEGREYHFTRHPTGEGWVCSEVKRT